jgi:phage-related protein
VADVIGNLINDLADNLAPGTKNFENLFKFIEDSAPIFDSLARTAGKFGSALLSAFANPAMTSAVQGLVGWLNDLADGFNNFVNSPAYTEWVNNGVSVFEHLGGLLESLGTALSGLFDKQTTDDLNNFIDGLGQFLEGPGKSLIDFLDELDVPGVLIGALNNLGNALKPIVDFLTDFMKANPDMVKGALEGLATALGALALIKITTAIVNPIQGLVALATGKNTSKINKFAAAFTGLGLALGSIAADPNAEGGSAATAAIGGALAGLQFGGPIGALVGTLAGLISSMITDVFLTPDVKGAWQNGWDQLFDPNNYTGAGIGPIKKWFQENLMGPSPDIPAAGGGWLDQVVTRWGETLEGFKVEVPNFFRDVGLAFQNGWTQITTFFDTYFVQPLQNGWNQIVTFFTVSVPGFFTAAGKWFSDGWNGLVKWFNTTFVVPTQNAWNGFVQFWTVQVPAWFSRMAADFQAGLNRLAAPFTNFFGDVKRNWENFWSSLGTAANNAWNTVRDTVNKIVSKIKEIAQNPFGTIGNLLSGKGFASGGVLMGPARILAGEAGPEAIVPLNRPLNQVDPSVRALSAFAQGFTPMASGGIAGGRSVTFAAGAFQINGALDPQRTALTVVNRIVERVAG